MRISRKKFRTFFAMFVSRPNTEQQERHVNTFSSVSLATSSRRSGEIITPGMIRMQAEMKQGERNAIQEQESRLGGLSKCLPKAENSIIPHRVLLKYPYAYQAHLERISDFLLCGEGAWWRNTVSGIEFIDVNTPDEDPRGAETVPLLHHFRSHTLKSESTYLQDEWNLARKARNIYLPRKLFFQNSKWLEKLKIGPCFVKLMDCLSPWQIVRVYHLLTVGKTRLMTHEKTTLPTNVGLERIHYKKTKDPSNDEERKVCTHQIQTSERYGRCSYPGDQRVKNFRN